MNLERKKKSLLKKQKYFFFEKSWVTFDQYFHLITNIETSQ